MAGERHGPGPPKGIGRAGLVDWIIGCASPIVLIEAPAGTGKSWLMAGLAAMLDADVCRSQTCPEGRLCLWDVPDCGQSGPLPDDFTPGARLILAKRLHTAVPGLARADVYGRVTRIPADALLLTEADLQPAFGAAAPDLIARTGGWACLLPAATTDVTDAALIAFLRDDVLGQVPSARLVALDVVLADPQARLGRGALKGVPFMEGRGSGQLPLPAPIAACQPALAGALADILRSRAADPVEARAIATARAAQGQFPQAIALFQSIGAWQAALDALRQGHGVFFIHSFGAEAVETMLAGFPADLVAQTELLVLSRAMQALKRGEIPLSYRILIDRYGPDIMNAQKVVSARDRYSLALRFFRLLMRVWEDADLDARLIEEAYKLLAELPPADDLRRGAFYNTVLDFYNRDRRFSQAEHAAARASTHYGRAGVPILSFYVDLHRAIIHLFRGDPTGARGHAARAASHFAKVRHDNPGDARLLHLLDACISYETGESEPLLRFLSLDLDALAQGEVWPTLIELVLTYATQALSEHFSTMAARAFLDRWRVTADRSTQFGRLINIREVVVLQNANRWQEGASKAQELSGTVTLAWVQAAGPALAGLRDRDDVALALVWLRHMAQITPARPDLDGLLRAMLDNPHLLGRQRTGAELWLAHVLQRQRRGPEAEVVLRRALAQAASQSAVATLGEERGFLDDLTRTRRFAAALERSDPIHRVLRLVKETGPGRTRPGKAHGLTRQETRILHALAEGAANKAIANLLGLSEATVKFHLSNLYRKLGCATRRDALAAARALRLVS